MGILNKIIHNDAIKQDPPEIYGWRVFVLACSVSFEPAIVAQKHQLTNAGLLRWYAVRCRLWYHWRCLDHEDLQGHLRSF